MNRQLFISWGKVLGYPALTKFNVVYIILMLWSKDFSQHEFSSMMTPVKPWSLFPIPSSHEDDIMVKNHSGFMQFLSF